MIPFLAASLLLRGQGSAPALPVPSAPTLPAEVRDWGGFKHLAPGPRRVPKRFPSPGDWSAVATPLAPNAVVWRTRIVVLDRLDRAHERGDAIVWPGHRGFNPPDVARIRRGVEQFRALARSLSAGRCDVACDVTEETETLQISGGDLAETMARYLSPRINGGRFEAEDGLFRGPYPSVFVIYPGGAESTQTQIVQGAVVDLVDLPRLSGTEVDGGLALALADLWKRQVGERAEAAGLRAGTEGRVDFEAADWSAIVSGEDSTTSDRLRLLTSKPSPSSAENPALLGAAESNNDTKLHLFKDPARGEVLVMDELGTFRQGGFTLPSDANGIAVADVATTPTLSFWMRSSSHDPIVVQLAGVTTRSVRIGVDVPFAYDDAWHPVKIDLRAGGSNRIEAVMVAPDANARDALRQTLGPIEASFSDFQVTTEAPDPAPLSATPSATSPDPMARAIWAASSGPGEARRALLKDPVDAVKANAVAAALARPDPGDEPALIEDSLYTFEPLIFTPALRALGSLSTPTARAALGQSLRSAAAERARGVAAEVLALTGDPNLTPLVIGLNQARTRAARISAIRALGRLPGSEAALMRMAFLGQSDPEVKLEATRTADENDDYQGRKLLWSAVNEPSDAVRLESLVRLSRSHVPEFQAEGLKGIHDDSLGVRVGLLNAWRDAPSAATSTAIRGAVADRAPRVRAAALDALATNPAPLEGVTFGDPDPRVQLAEIRLARAKGLSLPATVREAMRKSPDPQVRAAVGA